MNRRIVSLAVAWLVVTACAAGVFASGTPEPARAPGAELSGPGVMPIAEQKMTLTVLANIPATIQDVRTNYATRWLEDKTNVHFEWTIVTGGDAAQKINLILSSGQDLPDVLINTDLSADQQYLYGSQGILVPLNDLIEKHGFEIKRVLAADPSVKGELTSPDGNIYALSERPVAYHSTLSQKLWINNEWLTRLGLKMPTSTEEMFSVLKAFKDRDANGNGDPSDEIPYSGATNANRGKAGAFFMNAFIYDDGFGEVRAANRLLLQNGTIKAAYTQPEWREGLRYLNRLYRSGLFDAEAFVQDMKQLTAVNTISESVARVGSVQAMHMYMFASSTGQLHKQYVAVPPIAGPTGLRSTGYYPMWQRNSKFSITRAADPLERAAALKFADFCHERQAQMVVMFGEENVHWRWARAGEMAYTGEPAIYEQTVFAGGAQNHNLNHVLPSYFAQGFFDRGVSQKSDPFEIERRLWTETRNKYEGFQPKEVMPPLVFSLEDAPEYGRLRSQINTYVEQSFARFVTGNLDVERAWDTYLGEFKALELERYLDIIRKTYARQYGRN